MSNHKFINHGLGLMSEKEHLELVTKNAIRCFGEEDVISLDGNCVIASDGNGNRDCIFEGNLEDCEFQVSFQKQNFRNKKLFRARFPKAYFDYINKKYPKTNFENENREALNSLA